MAMTDPYSFTGTVPFFNASELQEAFARSGQLQLHPDDHKSKDALAVTSSAAEESGIGGLQVTAPAISSSSSSVVHYAKAGLLTCKNEAADGGKKASSRKWREWAVMLTPSQLVFFKDPHWVDLLNSHSQDGSRVLALPPGKPLKPDGVLPLDGFVAVFDFSFTKRPNTFMLIGDNGRQLLMQAPDGGEMNEWIGLINWAASFKNTGIKLRTETPLQAIRMRRPHASSVSQASARGAAVNHRNIYSTQGHVVGSAPGPDPAWEDDQYVTHSGSFFMIYGSLLIPKVAVSLNSLPKTISRDWVPAERLAPTSSGRASRTSTRPSGATKRYCGGTFSVLRCSMSCTLWRIRRATG